MNESLIRSDRWLLLQLRALALLTVAYFLIAGGWHVLFGMVGWNIAVTVFAIVWLSALASAWRHRTLFTRLDIVMLYLPLVAWSLSFVVMKAIVWHFAHGQRLWHTYGGDKGLSSFLLEPAVVGCGAALYFAHWRLSAHTRHARRFLLVVSLLTAVVTTIVMPPLPD
jgi:hypothetical protein